MATAAPIETMTLTMKATVTPEGLVLPPETMQKLALEPGRHVSITIHPSPSAPQGHGRAEDIVGKLRTMLAGGPSLEEEYRRGKDKDRQ